MTQQEIWIIDSDIHDREFLTHIWRDMETDHRLKFFADSAQLFDCLEIVNETPFIIICDFHMKELSGLELRKLMLEQHSERFESVPFIFWATVASDSQIREAYKLSIHGFFYKDDTLQKLRRTFEAIISYWHLSKMPPKEMQKVE